MKNSYNILCTICVRKNSKEIKNKNFIKFLDTNLTNYTIAQSKKIKYFDKIVLSTDLTGYKLKKLKKVDLIIPRSKRLSNDYVSKLDVIKHAHIQAEKKFNKLFDIIVDLDVTSPLREIIDIKESIDFFLRKKKSFNLITGTLAKKNPFFNQAIIKNGFAYPVIKSKIKRRQMVKNVYDLNAAIYIWRRKYLLNSKSVFLDKTIFFEMSNMKSIDIDSKLDFKLVEFLIKNR
jgi:CMP-N,N'-diacetyllegionaminic acid synthase